MIDPLTLLPLDKETIFESVGRTGRLVIAHEDTLTGGWGAEVAARVADECSATSRRRSSASRRRRAAPAAPVLENAILPQVAGIVATVNEVCR